MLFRLSKTEINNKNKSFIGMSLSIDLSSFKSAGIYTVEIDNTAREREVTTDPMRLIVGFANKGPFNRPVLLREDSDRQSIFGDIDTKMEYKGCYFNRMIQTLLTAGPVLALNLLNVDETMNGKDQVNWAAMSLDSAVDNPEVSNNDSFSEYNYATTGSISYVGSTPFASLYNRSRFWIPDKDLLTAVADQKLNGGDDVTFEHGNLLNFANVGTEEFSILAFKPSNVNGYDVTVESWYGGQENIPYGWLRPYDLISDYFIQVICVKGNWTNYSVLSTDPVWSGYFDKKGIKKNKINNFMYADGVHVLGSWSGVIIPDFIDKQGNLLSIERKINSVTETTGLLCAFNNDALNVLKWDLTGKGITASDHDENGQAICGIDINDNGEIDDGEIEAKYKVDMVGHGAFAETYNGESKKINTTDYESAVRWDLTSNTEYIEGEEYENPVIIAGGRDENNNPSSIFINTSWNPGKTEKQLKRLGAGNFRTYSTITNTGEEFSNNVEFSSVQLFTEDNADNNITIKTPTETGEYVTDPETGEQVPVMQNYGYIIYNVVYGPYNVEIKGPVKVDEEGKVIELMVDDPEWVMTNLTPESAKDYDNNIKFLSYNYEGTVESATEAGIIKTLTNAYYFSDTDIWENGNAPVSDDIKNMFIITEADNWADDALKVGDYVHNIAYDNKIGVASQYNLIPGVTRIIKKQFIQVDQTTKEITYKGKTYVLNGDEYYDTKNNTGFYLYTATTAVAIDETKQEIIRQVALSDDRISGVLNFIPMKGLEISTRHRPGYDKEGNLDIEGGIEKIYSKLTDSGIHRGLMNPNMANFRYVIDSMSYGIRNELGGKVYLSRLARDKGSCTAILNLPSAKQFAISSNPYFCDTYVPGITIRPGLNTKYIAEGGNTEMCSTVIFSLPTYEDGADYTACFFPHLIYRVNGRDILVPPAADVANVLYRKFTGVNNPYAICANMSGILSNPNIKDLEYEPDQIDRDYLEPFGVNSIIKQNRRIMIYGNQTAYQDVKSDKNKLHVRENLNTIELACTDVTRNFNFLYNTAAVRAELTKQIIAVLQPMQPDAIQSFVVQCDERNNTPEVIEADTMIVRVEVVMNHGNEKIVQQFVLQRRTEE